VLIPAQGGHDPGVDEARARAEAIPPIPEPIKVAGDHEVRVGTSSWTDPTMIKAGVFYPDGADTAEERLRYYASLFPVVEVDSTYYALPVKNVTQAWSERTPGHFLFDIKAHALFTGQPSEVKRLPKYIREKLPAELAEKSRIYAKDLPDEIRDELWKGFLEALEPLKSSGRLGAISLQFPRWVFPSHEAREVMRDAKQRLDTAGVPMAAEFRHQSWFNEKNAERTLKFLEDEGIAYVMVDEPQGLKSSIPPLAAVTSEKLAILRMHGRRAETWEQKGIPVVERFRYLYDEDELADWVPRIREAAKKAAQTHVLMNNCFGNYGTTNAREFAALLKDQL
jgi:uncharacterized protein YecE (DUF72 family)